MEKLTLQERIRIRIDEVHALAKEMPGVVIIHDLKDLSVVYMSPRGLEILGVTLQELVNMDVKYYHRFFNHEETKESVPKMIGLLERNDDNELVAVWEQVRRSEKHEWQWYCTSLKIFMRDDDGKPILTIAIAIPIDPEHHLSHKVVRLLEENNFLRKNSKKYNSLTDKEKTILKEIALGKTSNEIGEICFVSPLTVDTYRKSIKQKLGIKTVYEFAEYARAFDMI